jgi:hypothetical protein
MSEGQPAPADQPPARPLPSAGDGLGRSSSDTPTFRTGDPLPPGPPLQTPSRRPDPRPSLPAPVPGAAGPRTRPPQAHLPALLTAAAFVVVLTVVAVGTVLARSADTHAPVAPLPAPPALRASSAPPPQVPDSIEFRTRRGAGRLVVLGHTWVPGTPAPGPSGSQLRIRLQLSCTEGRVDYAPEYFSLFDTAGHLVELSGRTMGPDPLPLGRLGPGERVRGVVAFDVPRGDVTLVMGDDTSSVTAIRVTD